MRGQYDPSLFTDKNQFYLEKVNLVSDLVFKKEKFCIFHFLASHRGQKVESHLSFIGSDDIRVFYNVHILIIV